MKKNLLKTTASLLISGLFLFLAFGSGNNDVKKVSCDHSSQDYQSAYKQGKTSFSLGGSSDPDIYLKTTNNGYGAIGTISDCWREGYRDGFNGR